MWAHIILFSILIPISWQLFPGAIPDEGDYRHLYPTVCIAIRSYEGYSEYSLPYVMGLIEAIRYPKDRVHLTFILKEKENQHKNLLIDKWTSSFSKFYLSTSITYVLKNWREESLLFGRRKGCSYVFITDTDSFLMQKSLKQLINLNAIVVTPLLNTLFGNYTNVFNLLGDDFIQHQKIGSVYYTNEPILINLKHKDSSYLTFNAENMRNYQGNEHPSFVFAYSAFSMNISIFVDNSNFYGYVLKSNMYSSYEYKNKIGYFMANLVSDSGPMPFPHSAVLHPNYPEENKFGFDEIFLINLERRPERLKKMSNIFRLLGLGFKRFNAVDGQKLNKEELLQLKFLPGYEDPYHRRPMKSGEIGCFLSHYKIWQEIVDKKMNQAIILEDDLRFTDNSIQRINTVMEDIIKTRLEWEFIYLGRKKISEHRDEFFVKGHRYLSTIGYSYWTLGYAITFNGAKKLLSTNPLKRMMALDEYLPIMYNKHPNDQWREQFTNDERNLLAFSIYPPGYISDTEASVLIDHIHNTTQKIKDAITLNMEEKKELSTNTINLNSKSRQQEL